ncbi:MAG: DUF7033 domain-containing protein [Flavobacteriaceae bacterium]
MKINLTTSLESFVAHNGPKMSYGEKPLGNEFFIQSTTLLFEQGVQNLTIITKQWHDTLYFFEVGQQSNMPFDIFAASFYLISRYEEYLPHVKDEYGRFNASQSIAVQNGIIESPIVDVWIEFLYRELKTRYPDLHSSLQVKEKFMPIVEVVKPFKYLHKSFFRNVYQWGKSLFQLNFWDLIEHLLVLLRIRKDPWDTFDEFKSLFYEASFPVRFFFLFSKISYLDQGISVMSRNFQALIKEVADYFQVSLLASFSTKTVGQTLRKERETLNHLIHRPINAIRFAWGISSVGESYRNLLAQEIQVDYSMGYSNVLGYRASTAVPFFFYDLSNEMSTTLQVFPVVASERSLMHFSPIEAIKKMNFLEANLPLESGVHCFAVSNRILEKSEANEAFRSAFISYLRRHD